MKKVALFAFNGEPMCFVHVLLTALDMHANQTDVKVVIEGSATALVNQLAKEGETFHALYEEVKAKGLIDCACKACSAKTGALAGVEAQGIALCDEMKGHPSMLRYMNDGYEIITF